MSLKIIKPKALKLGDTIGVFTPSSPAYLWNEDLFQNGLKSLKSLGFKIKLGNLTHDRAYQGYRSGSPQARANEFMNLIDDPNVHALMSTIGGMNSSSMIPFLNYEKIRIQRKLICGFSDVTSLHTAILKFSGLQTLYGPSVMCWFGEWPGGIDESSKWFIDAAVNHKEGIRNILPPLNWSNHYRRWDNGDWKNIPRKWQENKGWIIINPGSIQANILALNLNTLMSSAGTSYWPDFKNKLLLLEDMEGKLARTERNLTQLKLIGVFDDISGLIISKPEIYDQENAPFNYEELFQEIIGSRCYPIISNFDCGHTVPMISIPQLAQVQLMAEPNQNVTFQFLDGNVNES